MEIEFYEEKDRREYEHFLSIYNEVKDSRSLKRYPSVEVRDYGDGNIAFHYPTSTRWTRFRGTFEELRDKLRSDFPEKFGNVELYTMMPFPPIVP